MFISKIFIKNYRLFTSKSTFEIDKFNVPDGTNQGSGLNVFVGENGCGKTTLLEALVLPILEFKSDSFLLNDMNEPDENVEIKIYSSEDFDVSCTMPKTSFKSQGFKFVAKLRDRGNKSYLSSMVVTDQLFIKSDLLDKPKDGSPDLRVTVNNPFSGKRFNENDIVFLDKNRIYQARSGIYNTTKFDKLMEDFCYQYNKNTKDIVDLNNILSEIVKKDKIERNCLLEVINKFEEISDIRIKLNFIDNYMPYRDAYFSVKKDNNQQIKLSNVGSGYEMIFVLIYSYYMSQQSGKQLIVLIDEPELHMHPNLQKKFVEFLLEISKNVQIFITTHSSLFIKQLSFNEKVKVMIIKSNAKLSTMAERKLPYISSNETNFLAFDLATEEYHNELYEELKYINGEDKRYKTFDNEFFIQKNREVGNYPWKDKKVGVSVHTYIRNQIHHRKDNGEVKYEELKKSIEKMRTYF